MDQTGRIWVIYLLMPFVCWMTACNTGNNQGTGNYYFDAGSGNDQNSGRSEKEAFQSLSRLQRLEIIPGDSILLRGGQDFSGTIRLKGLHGTAQAPIVLSSFGKGKAIIHSGDSTALWIDSCSHLEVLMLKTKGTGRLKGNKGDGILFSGVHFGVIDSVEVAGYLMSGIHIRGGGDIRITRSCAKDNGFCGIYAESGESSYGRDGSAFKTLRRIYIGDCLADNNPGCPAIHDNHSGNGILMGGVVNGTIAWCEARNNGWDMPREGNGPVGIWAYMSDSITIEHCYSHHNRTSAKGKDGGGFDLDGGMRYSMVQYNFSAFNEGAGYGIFQYAGATEWAHNVVRYNISYCDGSKNGKSGIFMWCDPAAMSMTDFKCYHNTVIGRAGFAVNFDPGNYPRFEFEDNLFLMLPASRRFISGHYSGAVFDHNLYWSADQQGRGMVQPPVPEDHHGIVLDPGLIIPQNVLPETLKPRSFGDLSYFILKKGSAAIGVANRINESGAKDFWNKPLTPGNKSNPGAWQGN